MRLVHSGEEGEEGWQGEEEASKEPQGRYDCLHTDPCLLHAPLPCLPASRLSVD